MFLQEFIEKKKKLIRKEITQEMLKEYIDETGSQDGFREHRKTEEYKRKYQKKLNERAMFSALSGHAPSKNPLVRKEYEKEGKIAKAWIEGNKKKVQQAAKKFADVVAEEAIQNLECNLKNEPQYLWKLSDVVNERKYRERPLGFEIDAEILELFLNNNPHGVRFDEEDIMSLMDEDFLADEVASRMMDFDSGIRKLLNKDAIAGDIEKIVFENEYPEKIVEKVNEHFTPEKVEELLKQNPRYTKMFAEIDERKKGEG